MRLKAWSNGGAEAFAREMEKERGRFNEKKEDGYGKSENERRKG